MAAPLLVDLNVPINAQLRNDAWNLKKKNNYCTCLLDLPLLGEYALQLAAVGTPPEKADSAPPGPPPLRTPWCCSRIFLSRILFSLSIASCRSRSAALKVRPGRNYFL